MKAAVLICNGESAKGYQPPLDAYSLCLNDGFRRHRANAILTVDCPESLREEWVAWRGDAKILAEHNAFYPAARDENGRKCKDNRHLFPCRPIMDKYRSSAAVGLAWLASQGFKSVTIVGMDALYGGGKPGAVYSQNGHADMLREYAPQFPDGLFILRNGEEVAADEQFIGTLATLGRPSSMAEPLSRKQQVTGSSPVVGPTPATTTPPIPQKLVEFDLCTDCTRQCEFCAPKGSAIHKRRKRKLTLDPERHNAVIDSLAESGFEGTICYAGHGEPLLHPKLLKLVCHARNALPNATLCIYTNGDLLTPRLLSALGVLLDFVVFDNYDDETGRKVYAAVIASTIHPSRVRCMDHVNAKRKYSSRCGEAGKSTACTEPCTAPQDRLFMAADGTWRLCCEDYGWKARFRALTPWKLNESKRFVKLAEQLAAGNRSKAHPICGKCDRVFGDPAPRMESHPRLVDIDRLRPEPTWPKVKRGLKRLVIIPCCASSQGIDQIPAARVVLDAIDRRSRVKGKTLLLWNDPEVKQCPPELRGDPDQRVVFEYDRALGWAGINFGIGEAFEYALREGYDAVIKMDAADCAIMRDGWDAWLLEGLQPDEMAGYVQVRMKGWADEPLGHGKPGPDAMNLAALPWCADYCAQGMYHDEWTQGGCYVLGRDAIQHMLDVVGMPTDAEARIGEDRAFSARAQVLQLPIRMHPRIMSFFDRQWDYSLDVARYWRDKRGCAVIHPIRNLKTLETLCGERA